MNNTNDDSYCQMCGLPMNRADHVRIRLHGEHPTSVRLCCDRCAKFYTDYGHTRAEGCQDAHCNAHEGFCKLCRGEAEERTWRAKMDAMKAAITEVKDKRGRIHVLRIKTNDGFVPEDVMAEIAHRAGLLSAADARQHMIHASHWEGGMCHHSFGIEL